MGLDNIKTTKDFKRIKEFLTAMKHYGIEESDLENIKKIPTIIEQLNTIIALLNSLKTNIDSQTQESYENLLTGNIEGLNTNGR